MFLKRLSGTAYALWGGGKRTSTRVILGQLIWHDAEITRRVFSHQTASSAVGPNAFYESDEISETKKDNVCDHQLNDITIAHTPVASPEEIAKSILHIDLVGELLSCPVLAQLHSLSHKLNERIFFYHEKNPHLGLLSNIKELIYYIYHYKLGPIKSAWYPILSQHKSLTELLLHHLDCSEGSDDKFSVADLAQLLDGLENKKGVSSCKFAKSVRELDNMIQFKYHALHPNELTVLQVLAQYAKCGYEIV